MSINIPLTEGYRLTSDKYRYILQEFKGTYICSKTNETKEGWKSIAFCRCLPSASAVLEKRYIDTTEVTTLKELKDAVESLHKLTALWDIPPYK